MAHGIELSDNCLEEQDILEGFIRSTKLLKIIEEKTDVFIKEYVSTKRPEDARAAIIFDLPLHFKLILEYSQTLIEFVVEEPIIFIETARILIYTLVIAQIRDNPEFAPRTINIEQIQLQFRFLGLPFQDNLLHNPWIGVARCGLALLTGVLSGYTEPEYYLIQAVWFCSNCDTNLITEKEIKVPKCVSCKEPMTENCAARCMGKQRFLNFFSYESVGTPRIFDRTFRTELVCLKGIYRRIRLRLPIGIGRTIHCYWSFGFSNIRFRSMGSKEVLSGLSPIKSIAEEDLDELLDISPPKEPQNALQFQHQQAEDAHLHTTDLFRNETTANSVSNGTPTNYQEFNLSFSNVPAEPSFCLQSQRPDPIDLSSNLKHNQSTEAHLVHPQIKDEPIDLSFQTPPLHKNTFDCTTHNDPNMDFSAFASTSRPSTSKEAEKMVIDHDDLPSCSHQSAFIGNSTFNEARNCAPDEHPDLDDILSFSDWFPDPDDIPSCSKQSAFFSNNTFKKNQNYAAELGAEFTLKSEPKSMETSFHHLSPIDMLTLSYSQTSISDDGNTKNNTRCDLHASQINMQADTTLIPESVLRLYNTVTKSYSDFAFVYAIAAQLVQDKCPMDCFAHLKLGLLLSIASIEEDSHRPPISVVAIGPEFDYAQLLMDRIGNMADRFVGPMDDFNVVEPKQDHRNWTYATPVVLARGGIYYLADWTRFKPKQTYKYFKMIEDGRVMLHKSTLSVPLETALWTHWRSFHESKEDQNTLQKFLEIFGIPLIIEEDNHEVLVDFILQQVTEGEFESTIDEFSIEADDMKKYLSIVSQRRVDLSKEATDLLRMYFEVTRKIRPDCLTYKSYTILHLFAESFAKLSLRHEVIAIDAVGAIYMAENYIQNVFGPDKNSPPTFKQHTYVGAVDEHMIKFRKWLNDYILQEKKN